MPLKKGFLEINQKEKTEVVDKLIEKSAPSYDFFLMYFLAVVITCLGLLINSSAVVIGGMLISPILYPLLSLAMGITTADVKLIRRSSLLLLEIVVGTLIVAALISLLVFNREINPEILSRISPNLAYFFIALIAGLAGAYAFAKPGLSEILPGIAIAVAVLPPLVVSGMGFSFLNWRMIIGSFGLFFINMVGVIFAGVLVFSLLGFYEKKKYISQKVIKEEKDLEKEKKLNQMKEIKEMTKKLDEVKKILTDNKKEKKF